MKFGSAGKSPEKKHIYWLKHLIFLIISKIKIFKYLARWIEQNIFVEKNYDYLFQKYKPDLIFCSSIYATIDVVFIKAARRFKVLSISMPKSWDTIGRLFFRAPTDKIILNNELMKKWVIEEQLIAENNIYIYGFPQFDVYSQKKQFLTKEQFCAIANLDKNKPIITYASEGAWTYWDEVYIDDLIKKNILQKYNLILRPHFTNLNLGLYNRFKKYKNIYVDDKNIRLTGMFCDSWDPTLKNMEWLAEVINASNVVIAFMSTFVLDSFALNKPVINIYYDLPESHKLAKKELTIPPIKEFYNCFHYNYILEENSTALAKNGKEVMEWIEKYLNNPQILDQERKNTIDKLCYKIDGQSSKRIADFLIECLK